MPVEDYEELSLEGMNVDTFGERANVLRARFPGGFRRSANVAPREKSWALSAGVLPDHADYGSLIDSDPRFKYYYDFWTDRMDAGNEAFVIEWRGKKYNAEFRETNVSFEVFTADLLAGGVAIDQVRVFGESYEADGSITPTP